MSTFQLPAPRATWVFAGDSITQGVAATGGARSWVEHVHERVRWQLDRLTDVVVNAGVSGWSSGEVLAEADHLVHRFGPTVLSISLGTNDAHTSKSETPEDTRANLVALARASGAEQVVLHTPVLPARSAAGTRPDFPAHVEAVRAAAAELDAVLVDHWAHWAAAWGDEEPLAWLHDPIHPNATGHLEMANLTLRTLGLGALEPEVWPPAPSGAQWTVAAGSPVPGPGAPETRETS